MFEDKQLKELHERRKALAEGVLQTPPDNYASFREVVGEYRGLTTAIDIITNVLKGREDL